jgi:hypothetical protein
MSLIPLVDNRQDESSKEQIYYVYIKWERELYQKLKNDKITLRNYNLARENLIEMKNMLLYD